MRDAQRIHESASRQAADFPQRSPARRLSLQSPQADDPVSAATGLRAVHELLSSHTKRQGAAERKAIAEPTARTVCRLKATAYARLQQTTQATIYASAAIHVSTAH